MNEPDIAYFHGFASSPGSRKGEVLHKMFSDLGRPLFRPNLNNPSFAELTMSRSLDAIDALDATEGTDAGWGIVGSSMGSYLAARWAELNPQRVRRLLLLCPGFDLYARWPSLMAPGAFEQWREEGSYPFGDPWGGTTHVHWKFMEDAAHHRGIPEVACPTVIIHGTRDAIVPVESSRAYVAARPEVRLLEVDDEHQLLDSIDVIVEQVRDFLLA